MKYKTISVSIGETQMVEKYLKKCSTALFIRKMPIRTPLRFLSHTCQAVKINKINDSGC